MIPPLVCKAAKAAGPTLVACAGFSPFAAAARELRVAHLADLDQLDETLSELKVASVIVLARTPSDVRRAAALSAELPKTRHILIVAAEGPPGVSPPVPAVPARWRTLDDLRVQRLGDGGWAIETRSATNQPAGDMLAATARALGRNHLGSPAGRPAGIDGPGATHWRPADPATRLVEASATLPATAHDLVVRTREPDRARTQFPAGTSPGVVERPASDQSWQRIGEPGIDRARQIVPLLAHPSSVPPIDERSVNPRGFLVAPRLGVGILTQHGVILADELLLRFHPSGHVTDVDVAKLRELRSLQIEWSQHAGPIAAVRVIAGLAAAGIPLTASRVPAWARALGPELSDLLTREPDLTDNLVREEHSVRLRRAALRTHGTRARWRQLSAEAGVSVAVPSPVSVLLCTRRPEWLSFALGQIARQRNVDLEVVLTLHGPDAEMPEVAAAIAGFDRPLTVVAVPAAVPFGVALNRGATRASGRFLAKMDDDDWYGPEHLSDMMLARAYSGADLVGCHNTITYLEEIGVTVQIRGDTERPHQQVAGPTLFLERQVFEEVGGFRPLPSSEDTQLQRAIEAAGGMIYRTHGLGLVYRRRASGHAWAQSAGYFLRRSIRQWRGFRPSSLLEATTDQACSGGDHT